ESQAHPSPNRDARWPTLAHTIVVLLSGSSHLSKLLPGCVRCRPHLIQTTTPRAKNPRFLGKLEGYNRWSLDCCNHLCNHGLCVQVLDLSYRKICYPSRCSGVPNRDRSGTPETREGARTEDCARCGEANC